MLDINGKEGANFQGKRGVNAADPINDKDVVNLRTLIRRVATATGSTLSASSVCLQSVGIGFPVYYPSVARSGCNSFRSLSAGTNLGMYSSDTITFYLKDDISLNGITANTITSSTITVGVIDAGLYLSAGTPLNFIFTERLWTASTGFESIVRNNSTGNDAQGSYSIIGGAFGYSISNFSVIAGGSGNTSTGHYGVIGGGLGNEQNGFHSFIGGGSFNSVSGQSSIIVGGFGNRVSKNFSSILGGFGNYNNAVMGSILGGAFNTANTSYSTVIGGSTNVTSGRFGINIGGYRNQSLNDYGIIGNGLQNIIYSGSDFSTILNGRNNTIESGTSFSSIIAGSGNTILKDLSNVTILGSHSITGLSSNTIYFDHAVGRSLTGVGQELVYVEADGHLYRGPIITGSGSTSFTGITAISNTGRTHGIFIGTANNIAYFKALSAGTNINIYSSSTENIIALNNNISVSGITASTITSTTIDVSYYFSAGTPLDFVLREKIWCASTGTQSIIRNNYSNNIASGNYSMAAGFNNNINGNHSVILGGYGHSLSGSYGFIGAGFLHTQEANSGVIVGGYSNRILYNFNVYSSILNGGYNLIQYGYSNVILAGHHNTAYTGTFTIIGNGYSNKNFGFAGIVGNGSYHYIQQHTSFTSILNGNRNKILTTNTLAYTPLNPTSIYYSFLFGYNMASVINGLSNTASTIFTTVLNGKLNLSKGVNNFIGHGYRNSLRYGYYNNIINGVRNSVLGEAPGAIVPGGGPITYLGLNDFPGFKKYNTVLNGRSNYIVGIHDTILGGTYNKTYGAYNTIINGNQNISYPRSLNSIILNGTGNTIKHNVSFSSILAGRDNSVLSGLSNVSILGVHSYSALSSNTTYMDHVVARSLTGGSIELVYVEPDGHLIRGAVITPTGSSSGIQWIQNTGQTHGILASISPSGIAYLKALSAGTNINIYSSTTENIIALNDNISVNSLTATTFYSGSTLLSTIISSNFRASAATISQFTGTPKTCTITFINSFPDANYSVTVTGEDERSWTVHNKTNSGFLINSNSNIIGTGTTYWIAQRFYI